MWDAIKKYLGFGTPAAKPAPPVSTPLENVTPVKLNAPQENNMRLPTKDTQMRTMVALKIVDNMRKDVLANQRESGGYNRSPRIDQVNKRAGAPMASPYCMAAAWTAIDDACKALGLVNPVPRTASSQAGWYNAPAKYQHADGPARMGDLAIHQVIKDPAHGHAMIVREDQMASSKFFRTFEANTGPDGGRDGDGWYAKTRPMGITGGKRLRGFVDVPQWIVDANRKA